MFENRNFPYPIILENGGDFKNAHFIIECNADMSKDNTQIVLNFKYELKCPFIDDLVKQGKLALMVRISQRTFRRSASLTNELKIPVGDLSPNYNIDILPMIVAKEDFSFKYDESMDIVFSYFDDDFEIKRYQIMGYGNSLSVELPTSNKVGSIFTLSKLIDVNEIAKKKPYIISLDNDVIDIKVLPEIYESFSNALFEHSSYSKIFYSTFVYPAVQLAIVSMLQDFDEYKDLKWCIAIANKIAKVKGISFASTSDFSKDDIIDYTNIVLDSLLLDAYNDISNGGDL